MGIVEGAAGSESIHTVSLMFFLFATGNICLKLVFTAGNRDAAKAAHRGDYHFSLCQPHKACLYNSGQNLDMQLLIAQ